MDETAISWTHRPGTKGRTWNVTNGCECCSPGCANCYAMRMAGRFSGPGKPYHGLVTIAKNKRAIWTGDGRFDVKRLAKPLSWRHPSTVFVNSMSDLFYDAFTNEEIAAVFGVMAATPQHTYIILTKRARRMREWFAWVDGNAGCVMGRLGLVLGEAAKALPEVPKAARGNPHGPNGTVWPLPNVWIGVSVEDQPHAYERLDDLLMTPAAVRLVSIEPMLGAVDLLPWFDPTGACDCPPGERYCQPRCMKDAEWRHTDVSDDGMHADDPQIDWVIVGCESGPRARPFEIEWARTLRDQCADYGKAFFFKQSHAGVGEYDDPDDPTFGVTGGHRKGRGHGGPIYETPRLDGVQHAAFPA